MCSLRYLVTLLVLVLIVSCNRKKEDTDIYKYFDEQIRTSNKNLSQASAGIYRGLEDKLADPDFTERAMKWNTKAVMIRHTADSFYNYIENVREKLKESLKNDGTYDESNVGAVQKVIINSGEAKKLWLALNRFQRSLDSVDPEITYHISEAISSSLDGIKTSEAFTKKYFDHSPAAKVLAVLSGFQHDIRQTENIAAGLCLRKIGDVRMAYSDVEVGIHQNASQLKPGDKLEITADVSAFTIKSQPEVFFEGKRVSQSKDGVAAINIRPKEEGNFSVPVTIRFKRPDGSKDSIVSNIKYVVRQ